MSYSRNFEFRVPPQSGQRAGRYSAAAATNIGAAVVRDGTTLDADDCIPVVAAGDDIAAPANGQGGILVYEELFTDGTIQSPSDKIQSPAGAKVQVVSGDTVKIVLRNSSDLTIVNTSGLAVGDGLATVDGGTWKENAGAAANSWAIVTAIDTSVSGQEVVEARLTF